MPLRENLWRDTVQKMDLKPPVSVPPGESIRASILLMQTQRTGCLFVEEREKLIGIFTERDLLKRVLGRGADVGAMIQSVMTPNPATARIDEPIGSVLQKFRDGGYRHLPVIDQRGRVVGRVTVSEIVHYMVEHFPKAVYNLPPKPDQVTTAPDGA